MPYRKEENNILLELIGMEQDALQEGENVFS